MFRISLFPFILLLLFSNLVFAESKIKIGVSLPLTGEIAYLGLEIKNVLEFVNAKYGKDQFQLIIEDDRCQAKEATAVANKFVNIDRVQFVLASCSMSILPTAKIYQKNNIPVIVTLGSATEISNLGRGIYRTSTNDQVAAKYLYDNYLKEDSRILALVDENDYSISFYKNFEQLKSFNQQIKAEYFKADNLDLRSVILRNKSFQPSSFMILPLSIDSLLSLVKQIRTLGFDQKIYSAYMNFPEGSVVGLEGKGIYNLLNASTKDFLTPEGKSLLDEYLKSYPPLGYDLVFVAVIESFRAMQEALINSPNDVNKYLSSEEFKGIIGNWRFNKNRDVDFWKYEVKEVSK